MGSGKKVKPRKIPDRLTRPLRSKIKTKTTSKPSSKKPRWR